MRTLKFRAWDGTTIHDNVVIIDGAAYQRNYFATMKKAGKDVIQYTGLKDCKGLRYLKKTSLI